MNFNTVVHFCRNVVVGFSWMESRLGTIDSSRDRLLRQPLSILYAKWTL